MRSGLENLYREAYIMGILKCPLDYSGLSAKAQRVFAQGKFDGERDRERLLRGEFVLPPRPRLPEDVPS